MKYVPPYGVADPNASYISGDTSIGRQGSIPPAEAFEHPMREISNVISKNRLTPSPTDLLQMMKAIRSQRANYGEDQGVANTLTVSYDPPLGQYTPGLLVRVKVKVTNTAASTIDAGGGRVEIRRPNGFTLQAGDLPAGGVVDLVFDGSRFQMVNFLPATVDGDIINNYNQIPYALDTSATPNLIEITATPSGGSLTAGDAFLIKVNNTNTGPTTIKLNAGAAVQVRVGDEQLLPGDINDNETKLFVFDGTSYQVTPNDVIPATVTIAIPHASYGATVNAVLTKLARKRIAPAAFVTLKMNAGVFGPITIYHIDSTRIIIAGTMQPGMTYPVINDFYATGITEAAQDSDASQNVIELRTHYATEIHVTGTQCGIENLGPGQPTVKDLLVVGDQTAGTVGIRTLETRAMELTGVAAWGLGSGFYTNGYMFAAFCSASACGTGFGGYSCTRFTISNCISVGHKSTGFLSDFFGRAEIITSHAKMCRIYGVLAAFQTGMKIWSIKATGNGTDIVSMRMSYIWLKKTHGAWTSLWSTTVPPADGKEGEMGARIEQVK